MGGFWKRSSLSSPPLSPTVNNSASASEGADDNAVSVQPAPVPVAALTVPLPTQWSHSVPGPQAGARAGAIVDGPKANVPIPSPAPLSSQTGPTETSPSPRQEFHPLPPLPFVLSPDQNPDLKTFSTFKPDPSSILLSYPRTNIDRIQDFYEIYNPPEKGLWNLASMMVMCGVGAISKTYMTFGSYTSIYNLNPFLKTLYDPHRTRPILTVTNHASTADDPLLWGALPWKCYFNPTKTIRFALGAQELCYPNKPVGTFFRLGQTVPIIRGVGIYQPAIDKSINLLRNGRWVHIFPEGKINQTDQSIRLKWGVGRILMEYGGPTLEEGGKPMDQVEMPIVIPIYHLGMEDILRLYPDNSSPVFPKLGAPLTIVFGKPIDFRSLMQEYKEGKVQEVEARIKITERVFEALDELKKVAIQLHQEQIKRVEQDRIEKGRWWWVKPYGWGWWNSKDIEYNPKNRDTSVKYEEL
ncbi:hypothetical protein BX616_006505 [Lobosporangium transversale]|uniref:Tafazzin family protein n=1 Tax=Lobosporangium transversale TaxID=64571 RepID=A0A1Y2GZA6_9FUNG|nr:acyltransferase-domain-containing protein [Lobosporangium transversale]KAF9915292.1 hypothetical protein BX616_006505 [Lobosporangium transversale]ORZ27637.1 acyltransferase-domain-containing protein [Lobosporangium transversale]|eukprot:XP_021885340.1 acyltransferase-domain-containing protein [Lobosporangium transversale]